MIAMVYEHGGRLSDADQRALKGADLQTKLACKEGDLSARERRREKVAAISRVTPLDPDTSRLVQEYARI